jgi:hypothetical protein
LSHQARSPIGNMFLSHGHVHETKWINIKYSNVKTFLTCHHWRCTISHPCQYSVTLVQPHLVPLGSLFRQRTHRLLPLMHLART